MCVWCVCVCVCVRVCVCKGWGGQCGTSVNSPHGCGCGCIVCGGALLGGRGVAPPHPGVLGLPHTVLCLTPEELSP